MDFNKGTSEFKPIHYTESSSKGRIWIDGVEIDGKRAMQLRRGFTKAKEIFQWGWQGAGMRITSLAICLHIFKDEQVAVNMYLPFMREVLGQVKRESFEIEVDLEDFINEHADRMSHNFFTQWFDVPRMPLQEINFKMNRVTGMWSADIVHQVCTDYVGHL